MEGPTDNGEERTRMPIYVRFSPLTVATGRQSRGGQASGDSPDPGTTAAAAPFACEGWRPTVTLRPATTCRCCDAPTKPIHSNEQMYSAMEPATEIVNPLLPGTRKKFPATKV